QLKLDRLARPAGKLLAARLAERQIAQPDISFAGRPSHHRGSGAPGPLLQFRCEPRLAHPGVPTDHHRLPVASVRGQQGILEKAELALTTDQHRAEGALHQTPHLIEVLRPGSRWSSDQWLSAAGWGNAPRRESGGGPAAL